MKLLIRAVAAVLLGLLIAAGGALAFFILSYPRVGPAPDILIAATPQRIERGRYLVNDVVACLYCHSTRNWDEFAAPIVAGTEGQGGERFGPELGFPTTFYAPNITPAALGEWTDGEILLVITSGVTRQRAALFTVMPYPSYNALSKDDAEAIVAYLRTLRPIRGAAPRPRLGFPLNLTVRTLPQPWVAQPTPDAGAGGEYLLTIAACGRCHTPTDRGEPIAGMAYAGGTAFPLPHGGVVRSSNITPDPDTGIGSWDADFFVRRFRQAIPGDRRRVPVAAGEFNTVMPWTAYAGMTDVDLRAIYAYLRVLRPVRNSVNSFSGGRESPDRRDER